MEDLGRIKVDVNPPQIGKRSQSSTSAWRIGRGSQEDQNFVTKKDVPSNLNQKIKAWA